MITHIVLLKLQNRDQESIEKMKEVILSMKGKIECLRDLTVAADFFHAKISYDVAMIAQFDSKEDLNMYLAHPAHIEVGKYIENIQAKVVAVDYEI